MQENAYQQFGAESWTCKGVPLHVTSNRVIARQYVEIALERLRDRTDLSFLELGGGSGRFAYLFLCELLSRRRKPIRYYLTDFAEKNVAFWREHPLFRKYLEGGLLHLSVYNPLEGPPPCSSPFFVIANYFFDSVEQDLFQVREGRLFEGRVTLYSKLEKGDDPSAIGGLEVEYAYEPVALEYYENAEWNRLLKEYAAQFNEATFLFPVGALRVLGNLSSFHLLAADKGYCTAEQIQNWRDPHLNLHGTISFPVNFHLLAKFMKNRGGEMLFSSRPNPLLTVSLVSSGKIESSLRRSFQEEPFELSVKEPEVDERFFPLCKEEALKFYDLPGEEGRRLASLCETLPSAQRSILAKGRALQIGPARGGFCAQDLQILPLSDILTWPLEDRVFDEIHFFAPPAEIRLAPRSLLVRQGNALVKKIEEQFPDLNQRIYSDAEIESFFQSSKNFSTPSQYVEFFFKLEMQKQISESQRSDAILRLKKEGQIREEDLQQYFSQNHLCASEDVFSLFKRALERCLKGHMKKGSCFYAYFPGIGSLHEVDGCLEELVANPWIEYSEEFLSESKTLVAKIRYES